MEGLSRDHILWAYRLLLDREAGPLDDVDAKLAVLRSTRDLRTAFLASPEYTRFNPAGAGFIPQTGRAIAELPENLRLFVDLADRMIGINILQGSYEREEIAFARTCVDEGDQVLDIGANIGFFTVQLANWVGESGSVVAFEPVPANLELLRKSIAENRFEARVRVVPAVVADEEGEAELLSVDVRYAHNSGGSRTSSLRKHPLRATIGDCRWPKFTSTGSRSRGRFRSSRSTPRVLRASRCAARASCSRTIVRRCSPSSTRQRFSRSPPGAPRSSFAGWMPSDSSAGSSKRGNPESGFARRRR